MGAVIQRISALSQGSPVLARTLAVLTVLLLVGISYFGWFRPYQLRWGATEAEIGRTMPGDELNPDPSFLATRAITIAGAPKEVWPWLLQMGYGRAGFYAYDLLENLGSPTGMRSAEEILPEFQRFRVGDEVPISAVVSMEFHAIEPHRHLIWIGSQETAPTAFTWALYPRENGRTRLVSRIRFSHGAAPVSAMPLVLFAEFTDHIAVRKILLGVRGRVEGDVEPRWVQNAELAVFVATFLTFTASLLLIFLRLLTWRTWGVGVLAGAIWLTTWYSPVPLWLGVLLVLAAIGAVSAVGRKRLEAPE